MMIRKGMMFGGSVAAIALFAGSALAAAGPTPTPLAFPFPQTGATLFKTTFARAENACAPRPGPWGVGVVTVQVTGGTNGMEMGCVADPNNTSPMHFGNAQLTLHKAHGKYILNGTKFPLGTQVDLVLSVQVTRKLVHTDLLGTQTVTFPVQEATCPTATVNAKGVLLQSAYLDDCLSYKLVDPTPAAIGVTKSIGGTENTKFSMVNIEVQSATIKDHVTGLTIGAAGIVR
ncbi:MAG TPA: hypothetical protein VF515_02065 [Candidatus Binatia bacterium]